jgi:hypothetical protein
MGPPMMMGGMGMGMGLGGSPLLSGLMTGGIGYLLGRNSGQQQQPYVPVQQASPAYPQQAYYPPPQSAPYQASTSSNSGDLAQLKLLGDLHDRGVLTDDEFAREKASILGG